jgi:fructosamine-3-kinase
VGQKLGKFDKGGPLPKSMGRCADLYKEVEELYREMNAETEEVKARLSEIREHLIANLSKSDDTGAAGLRYRAQIKTDKKPTVRDWDKFYAYIYAKKRFDLLQRRISDKAALDILDEEGKLPGVERINVPKVSITKI